jgi:hypothetical protein
LRILSIKEFHDAAAKARACSGTGMLYVKKNSREIHKQPSRYYILATGCWIRELGESPHLPVLIV